jgi:peroxiredoxin
MAVKDEHLRGRRTKQKQVESRLASCLETSPDEIAVTHQASLSPQDDRSGSPGEAGNPVGDWEEARRVVDGLVGRLVPSLLLVSFRGEPVDLGSFATRSVAIYLYPGGCCSPDGGEDSPMLDAAQHRAFGAYEHEMAMLNLAVFGVSSQWPEVQRESAEATRVGHPLLSDPHLLLAEKLGLPTFEDHGARRYRRLTMVVHHGRVGKVFYPVRSPARNPAQVVAWTKVQAR